MKFPSPFGVKVSEPAQNTSQIIKFRVFVPSRGVRYLNFVAGDGTIFLNGFPSPRGDQGI